MVTSGRNARGGPGSLGSRVPGRFEACRGADTEAETPDWFSDPRFKKADLHCHSVYSTFKYFRVANTRDSYNRPEEVYRLAKERGMDFVTITDHDSIDGCLALLDRRPDLPDFFISEEVETWFPETRQRIHVNVFDIDEKQHAEISRRRHNIYDLHEYIREERIIASANHMFQNYRMRNSPRRYFDEMLRMFDIFEVKNGAMTSHHNRLVEDLMAVVREKKGAVSLVAGSDAHTLAPLARVYTVAEAGGVQDFLEKVRTGACFVWGSEMGFRMLLSDVYRMVFRYYGSFWTGKIRSSRAPRRRGTSRSRPSALPSRPRASRSRSRR